MKLLAMKQILCTASFALFSVFSFGQINLQWEARYNNPGGNFIDKAVDLQLDAAGNTYVTGTSYNGTDYDIVTVKYDNTGTEQWVVALDGPAGGLDEAYALALDASNDVFITGAVYNGGSDWDIVTAKYNGSTGALIWSDILPGTSNYDSGRDIQIDGTGRVVVCGTYSSSATNVQFITMQYPNAGAASPTWNVITGGTANDEAKKCVIDGSNNIYVAGHSEFSSGSTFFDFRVIKYNSSGVQQWNQTFDSGSGNLDTPHSIALDPSNNVIVGGQAFTTTADEEDYFVIKVNGSTGALLWNDLYAGNAEGFDRINAVTTDGAGNVFVTGQSKSTGSSEDYYTIAYNSAGVELWNHRFSSDGLEFDEATDLEVSASDLYLYVTGYSYQAGFNNDYTTLKYDIATGSLLWQISFNGPASNSDQALKMELDPLENIFVTGNSHGGVGFNLDYSTIKYCQLTSVASNDTSICVGQTVDLTVTGGSNETWTVLSGDMGSLSCSVCATTTVDPTVTSVYLASTESVTGCVDYDTVTVTVNPIPSPTIYNDTPLDFCIGDSVVLYTDTYASYSWSPGGSTSISQTCYTAATYTLTIVDSNGCSNTADAVVTNFPAPPVDAGALDSICVGESYTLGATGAVSYLWDVDVTLSLLNIPNPVATPTSDTWYYVTGTDASGCTAYDSVFIHVNTLPSVNAGADEVVCVGDSVQITATGAVTYSWNFEPSLSSTTIADPYASPTSLTEYFVTGTDANGCSAMDSIIVSTIGLPNIQILGDVDTAHCLGDSIQLFATGGLTALYVWDADPALSSTTVFNPWESATTTTTFVVTGTDINGCSNTDEILVTVYADPPVSCGPDDSFCVGDSIQLNATGAVSYLWNSHPTLSELNISNPWATPSVPTTYTVTGTDANGCEASDAITITIDPLPTIVITTDDSTICEGDSTQLLGTGGVSYLWAIDFTLSEFIIADPWAYPTVTTTYSVTGTDINGCQGEDEITITVSPAPAPPVITQDSVWLISNYITGNQWYFEGSAIGGATDDTLNYYLYGENGHYWVVFTDPYGCTSMSDTVLNKIIVTDVGIAENEAFYTKVYPNPSNGMLYIDVDRDLDELVLIASNGQLIGRRDDIKAGSNELDLSNLPKGIYILKMIHEDRIVTKRIIKQ